MMLLKHTFHKLPALPFPIGYFVSKPIYHPNDPSCIILSTEKDMPNSGIYKYDLENNHKICLAKYDEIGAIKDNYLEYQTQFLDPINNKLYICGGEDTIFITYAINTGQIKAGKNNPAYNADLANCGPWTEMIDITTQNEIHSLTAAGLHYKFNYIQKKLIIYENSHFGCTFEPKLAYNSFSKQLMVLGGEDSVDIWTCDIKTNVKWILNIELKMPHKILYVNHYDVLFIGDILFVFYHGTKYNDIWCLDLLNELWYKSKYIVPEVVHSYCYIMKIVNNAYVHILDFENGMHFKINFHDLLPIEFIKARREYYKSLVFAYIRQQVKRQSITNIPLVLKRLILNYFPIIADTTNT